MPLWKTIAQRPRRGEEYATTLVGNVIRIPRWASFADTIDWSALDAVTGSITGLGQYEVAGAVSRPGGDFLWEPHPVFARVGVPEIRAATTELGMVLKPGPSTPADKRAYTIVLRASDRDDIDVDTELNFVLKWLWFTDIG